MLTIAKLTIHLNTTGIKYNTPAELETKVTRGSVLPDGKVVRGMGTHYLSKDDKDRHDALTSRANEIREEFNRRFTRFMWDGVYCVPPGAGRAFAESFASEAPAIQVSCVEVDATIAGDLSERDLLVWGGRVKEQLSRTPLGRAANASDDGLDIIEGLAACPILSDDTKLAIGNLVKMARAGALKCTEFRTLIEELDVKVNANPMMAPRSEAALK